jgi:hypothetical protein
MLRDRYVTRPLELARTAREWRDKLRSDWD